jgi:hypothetical protein
MPVCWSYQAARDADCEDITTGATRFPRSGLVQCAQHPGTVVSSRCSRSAAMTWARSRSNSGISAAGQAPTWSANVDRLKWHAFPGVTLGLPVQQLILAEFFDDYLVADGLRGSLSRHADEILNEIARDAPQRRDTARRLFCLVTEGEVDRAARRLATVAEVMAVTEQPIEEIARIADAFRAPGSSLLMPPLDQRLAPSTVLDISHESLIRNWQTLKDWVRAEALSVAQYRETEHRVQDRLAGGTAPWDPPELHAARDWIEREHPNAAWAGRYGGNFDQLREFVETSSLRQRRAIHAVGLAPLPPRRGDGRPCCLFRVRVRYLGGDHCSYLLVGAP